MLNMRKLWKKALLGLLAALMLLAPAAAEEPEELAGVPGEPETAEEEVTPWEPEIAFCDDPFIDLDVTGWADTGDEVSLLDGELAGQSGYSAMKEELSKGLIAKQATITISNRISGLTVAQLSQLFYNAVYSNPEQACFARTGYRYYQPANGTGYALGESIRVLPSYLSDYDPTAYQNAVDAAYAECIDSGMTDLEKVVAAHDWLVLNCQYDPYVSNQKTDYTTAEGVVYGENEQVYTSYGAFVNGNAVCQGYALAFKVFMDRAGIPCCYVSSARINHGWNMVQLDGAWYHVDVTWDDPIYANAGDAPGMVSRNNFLLSDDKTASIKGLTSASDWTTENGYVCADAYTLPTELEEAAGMGAYLIDGSLYLMNDTSGLKKYPVGTEFASDTAETVVQPVQLFRAAALDREEKMLYYVDRYSNVYAVYAIDLADGDVETIQMDSKVGYGLKLRENPDFPGTKELCTWSQYAPVERIPVGLASTEKTMPVVILYPASMLDLSGAAGKSFSVTAGEACEIYLACYSDAGKMLRVTSLGAVAAGQQEILTIGSAAIDPNAGAAGIMAVAQESMEPLASAIKIT